ncbi:MAG: CpsB/CapC family capsule biosynthesis tyrosine phosphatase [Bacteroidota bacterium]
MGVFGNIFKSNKLKVPVDLSLIGTDMHSHLIPGLDDGSKSLEESVELIRRMHSLGYKKLIMTPHIMSDYFKNKSETILKGLDLVRNELEKQQIPIVVEVAAEYMFDEGLVKKFKAGNLLTFGKKYVLIELSAFVFPENLFHVLFDMKLEGYNPILAHPERYSYWHYNFEHYVTLKDREIFFQINIPSLSGFYSNEVKKICENLIENNMVDFAGSDLHNMEYLQSLEKARYSPQLEKLISSGKLLNSTL